MGCASSSQEKPQIEGGARHKGVGVMFSAHPMLAKLINAEAAASSTRYEGPIETFVCVNVCVCDHANETFVCVNVCVCDHAIHTHTHTRSLELGNRTLEADRLWGAWVADDRDNPSTVTGLTEAISAISGFDKNAASKLSDFLQKGVHLVRVYVCVCVCVESVHMVLCESCNEYIHTHTLFHTHFHTHRLSGR
jgi:hypothetical protein